MEANDLMISLGCLKIHFLDNTRACLFNLASSSRKYPFVDHCFDDLLQDAIQVPRIASDSLVFLKSLVPQVARAAFRLRLHLARD